MERLGLLDGIVRDPTGRAEFIDKNGQKWDIKSFNSNYSPKKGGFTLQKAIQSINRSLSENENVIVNTTQMKDNDLEKLKQEVNALGIRDKVIFWPL